MIEEFPSPTQLILLEAKKRGIVFKKLIPRKICILEYKGHEESFFHQCSSKNSFLAKPICSDKSLTKHFLSEAGISVPAGKSFNHMDQKEANQFFLSLNKKCVIKPAGTNLGRGISTGVVTDDDFVKAWNKAKVYQCDILIEEQFKDAEEYRIFASSEKVLAVCRRTPAGVVGDGEKTIRELIKEANKTRKKSHAYIKEIKIDYQLKNYLNRSGLNLDSIPSKDTRVQLVGTSNIATGGESEDFTEKIHPSVAKIAVRAVQAVPGLVYAGLDFMTKDIAKENTGSDYVILEMNESPCLSVHHFPFIGEPRDIAKEIINITFPETKGLPNH